MAGVAVRIGHIKRGVRRDMTTIVKVCGLTGIDDARAALKASADWIGLNLVAGPRKLEIDAAIEIASQLPDVSRVVALVPVTDDDIFVETLRRLSDAGVRRLQLYGDVSTDTFSDLRDRGFSTLAVLRAKDRSSLEDFSTFLAACGQVGPDYVVVDAFDASSLGGTGQRADWAMIHGAQRDGVLAGWPPMILAGGLTPENVAQAIETVSPFGVDVSSGVESSVGKKDQAKVESFITAAKGA